MTKPYLSPDDLPTYKTTQISELLLSQLEEVTKKRFFLACNSMVRILLSSCHWYFKVNSGILMLIMVCHNIESYQNIMTTVPYLAETLKRFANKAKISISSPVNNGIPWVISIDKTWPGEELPNT
ncbi:hypothetical protein H6G54_17530 [Anabaena cylindrica FACHB-243]|uniref:Uncharacterized protein n=1 Tax=Anabaena cylindrica (strain ATCC 27899 / PCC 7122) TaxID=272123 RepID=K9ZI20_ANACC|nr:MULTISPECIES: hypothetical protein [Anabaena]AFZ58883.1 hypothetical protein Anacy_3485 [Anabaena cylindrica PCC 7122]MBD2419468.1 hypothetical protein [Anabaena cylindrica FACHB-243]MBY5283785.1 hypothetical protein [Anabaena sp. CCAP 1446/1C]MBY5306191.1 hypothetical protein [Anabaena sp. CCAP 1446/1C]MCM2408349.1 hypothetical protein [Anabaena sp. CCAP 1446/1C]